MHRHTRTDVNVSALMGGLIIDELTVGVPYHVEDASSSKVGCNTTKSRTGQIKRNSSSTKAGNDYPPKQAAT
jgi:hypothetical protein